MGKKNSDSKPWYDKWWFYLIIVSTWLFLIKIVDAVYLKGFSINIPNTTLDSSDLITYLGGLLAALITILTIKISANHSKKLQDEIIISNVTPCISINHQSEKLTLINPNKDISKLNPGDKIIFTPVINDKEYIKADKRYFFNIDNGIRVIDSLTKEQERKLGTFIINSNGTVEHTTQLMLIKLTNVGKDAAVNFHPVLYRIGTKKTMQSIPTVFPLHATFYIAICFARDNDEYGEYILELHYEDIYGNIYRQNQQIFVKADGVIFNKPTCDLVKTTK
ncbi:MAG: hypothetical protein LLF75_07595 [Eubacteriales bacterium]|nr:hypothetical protein [Eubacteriales bacterium]